MNNVDNWEDGYTMSTQDDVLIYPSAEFPDAENFFTNFSQMSIPFMDGYQI